MYGCAENFQQTCQENHVCRVSPEENPACFRDGSGRVVAARPRLGPGLVLHRRHRPGRGGVQPRLHDGSHHQPALHCRRRGRRRLRQRRLGGSLSRVRRGLHQRIAAQPGRRGPLPTSPARPAWRGRGRTPVARCLPTSTATAGSTSCAAASRTPGRRSTSTGAMVPSWTSPRPAASRPSMTCTRLPPGDYDRDGDLDLFTAHWWGATRSCGRLWRNDGGLVFACVDAAAGDGAAGRPPGQVRFCAQLRRYQQRRLARHPAHGGLRQLPGVPQPGQRHLSRYHHGCNQRPETAWGRPSATTTTTATSTGSCPASGTRMGPPAATGRSPATACTATTAAATSRTSPTRPAPASAGGAGGRALPTSDNDGHLDLYHVNGYPIDDPEFEYDPAQLFISDGDGTFTERAREIGARHLGQGRGIVCFDYDRDGRHRHFRRARQRPPTFCTATTAATNAATSR